MEISNLERCLLLRMLDEAPVQNFDDTRAVQKLVNVLATNAKLVPDGPHWGQETALIETSQDEASDLARRIRVTLDYGRTPGRHARVLLHLHDRLTK